MNFDIGAFVTNPYVLMTLCIFTGILLGKIKLLRGMGLGISGVLFTGLLTGWLVYGRFAAPYESLLLENPSSPDIPKYAETILKNGLVSNELFSMFLVLFIASVGLLAARDIKTVIRKHGLKFLALGLIVTFVGALTCFLMAALAPGQNVFAVTGVYIGALTSSPGLGTALEFVAKYGAEVQAMVGTGHAIGYPFGILIVILGVQFLPNLFKVKRQGKGLGGAAAEPTGVTTAKTAAFDLAAFSTVCLAGYGIGAVKIGLGSLVAGSTAMLTGFLAGHYLFKIDWVLLSGALCGGLTITPGLGVAVEAAGSDEPAAGYGATYPFALFGMVFFTILLHTIPIG